MRNTLIILLALNCLSVYGQTSGVNYEAEISKANAFIDSLMNAQNIPAISVAVGVKGKLVWTEAYGYADLENKIPATTETKFRAGSIGKPWTMLALGKLYDQGSIEFDDALSDYLEQFKEKKYSVSIRQLAGHMGGIRHYKGFEYFSNKQYQSVKEAMEHFIDDPLKHEPGTAYLYSTYGYVVLGRLIELVSGKNYLDYMYEEVFDPLRMTNTIAENSGIEETNKAVFYAKGGKRKARKVNLSNKWAAGGFLSTPTDMVNSAHYATKIVSAQTLYELITRQKLPNGESTGYGMGWRLAHIQSNNRQLVYHGGRSVGARAFLLLVPEEQVVVAICTNTEADYGVLEAYKLSKFFMERP